jgi:hypothetical protein
LIIGAIQVLPRIFERIHVPIEINFSTVFAGPTVGIKAVHDDIWLVSLMD